VFAWTYDLSDGLLAVDTALELVLGGAPVGLATALTLDATSVSTAGEMNRRGWAVVKCGSELSAGVWQVQEIREDAPSVMALALVLVLLVLGLVVVNTWGTLALNGLSTL
jgi:hypothetical protein